MRRPFPTTRNGLLLGAAAVATVLAGLVIVVGYGTHYIDLEVYRFAAEAVLRGADPYDPLPPTSANIGLPFIYPPAAALLYVPFAVVPLWLAASVTFLLNVAALYGTCYAVLRERLGRAVAARVACFALPAAMLLEPLRDTLHFGQVNIWLMLAVVLDCTRCHGRIPRGVLTGIAAGVKLTPAGFLLFFLVCRDWKAARNMVLSALVTVGIGWLAAPQASVRFWTGEVLGGSSLSGSTFATNQGLLGELDRLVLPPAVRLVVFAVLAVLVVAATAVLVHRGGPNLGMLATAVAVLLLSPISWSHHWVWIAPALVLLVFGSTGQRPWPAIAGLTAVFALGPFHLLPSDHGIEVTWTWWQHLVGNAYLEIALVWLLVAAVRVRRSPRVVPTMSPSGSPARA